ncbi:MAG: radical SAM family heme chaperone HemW [Dysgonamonadaceae bacterium]|jgi:oxygen-independent coproporphyrinogen-3 oxidase|nr:radical SAM family heme chaperone HemW [Dysgonamonadaceae bacterium]
MAGIYIHIPFCKKRCAYCDFFSSEQANEMSQYIDAVCRETVTGKNYLNKQPIDSVYFGGGTPSQLNAPHFEKIFRALDIFNVSNLPTVEITLEANPDDITDSYIDSIHHLPFNRISLGVQSFNDSELETLGRRHDAKTATKAIECLQGFRYRNISIDLMYGLPGQTEKSWRDTVRQALSLGVQHISAYHLTYEKGTPLSRKLKQGKICALDEDLSLRLFDVLIEMMTAGGFEHYEISNFAMPGYHSRHNCSYWNGSLYLGLGAAAHSYNGHSRQWNVASIKNYINSGFKPDGFEKIDTKTAYNDFVMTRLRTAKGIDSAELYKLFGKKELDYCLHQAQKHIKNALLHEADNCLRLTRRGIFISDMIISDLMM